MTSTRRKQGVRLRWTHLNDARDQATCGRPPRKLKLESSEFDVMLSSSPSEKLASLFLPEFVFGRKKGGNFSATKIPSTHLSMGSVPKGVQCPLTSSLGEFLGYWVDSGILG